MECTVDKATPETIRRYLLEPAQVEASRYGYRVPQVPAPRWCAESCCEIRGHYRLVDAAALLRTWVIRTCKEFVDQGERFELVWPSPDAPLPLIVRARSLRAVGGAILRYLTNDLPSLSTWARCIGEPGCA